MIYAPSQFYNDDHPLKWAGVITISGTKVLEVMGAPLLPSQKVILLILEAAARPLSMRDIMEILNHPWPAHRGRAQRPLEYLVSSGAVALNKSKCPHLYSLPRIA